MVKSKSGGGWCAGERAATEKWKRRVEWLDKGVMDFINVFSKRVTCFHRWSSQATKSSSLPSNLPGAQPFVKPLTRGLQKGCDQAGLYLGTDWASKTSKKDV